MCGGRDCFGGFGFDVVGYPNEMLPWQGAGGESPPPPRARPRFQEGGGGNGGSWWHGTANTATFPLFPRRFPAPPPPSPPTSPPFFSASGSSPPFPKSAGVFYENSCRENDVSFERTGFDTKHSALVGPPQKRLEAMNTDMSFSLLHVH